MIFLVVLVAYFVLWIVVLIREVLVNELKVSKLENRISKLEGIVKRNNLW